MFCPLSYRDTIIIVRSLLVLVLVIALGVSVSERQLNSLTQRNDGVQVINISSDNQGLYSIFILGSSYQVSATYPVGEVISDDKTIIIKTSHHTISIPTYIEVDCKKELIVLDLWARLAVDKGLILKERLAVYVRQFR